MSEDKMLERIKRLLALAEHHNTPEAEAQTAQEQAEKLMVRHGIELAQLADRGTTKQEMVRESVFFAGTYRQGLSMVMNVISAYKTCFVLYSSNTIDRREPSGKIVRGDRIHIVGPKAEVEKMVTLARSLEVQSMTALNRWWDAEGGLLLEFGTPSDKYKTRRQFLMSFMAGAASRVSEIVRTEAPAGTSTALALVNQEERSRDAAKDMFGGWSTSAQSLAAGSYFAKSAGRAAGREANINQSSIGARRGIER